MYTKFVAEVTVHTDAGMHAVLHLVGSKHCGSVPALAEYVGQKLTEAMDKFTGTQTEEIKQLRQKLAALEAQHAAQKEAEKPAVSPNIHVSPKPPPSAADPRMGPDVVAVPPSGMRAKPPPKGRK